MSLKTTNGLVARRFDAVRQSEFDDWRQSIALYGSVNSRAADWFGGTDAPDESEDYGEWENPPPRPEQTLLAGFSQFLAPDFLARLRR